MSRLHLVLSNRIVTLVFSSLGLVRTTGNVTSICNAREAITCFYQKDQCKLFFQASAIFLLQLPKIKNYLLNTS